MSKFGKELIQSMTEALEHSEGKDGSMRVQVVEVPNVPRLSSAIPCKAPE